MICSQFAFSRNQNSMVSEPLSVQKIYRKEYRYILFSHAESVTFLRFDVSYKLTTDKSYEGAWSAVETKTDFSWTSVVRQPNGNQFRMKRTILRLSNREKGSWQKIIFESIEKMEKNQISCYKRFLLTSNQ